MEKREQEVSEVPAYEPPSLTVLGPVYDLTQGPIDGTDPDDFFPHHLS